MVIIEFDKKKTGQVIRTLRIQNQLTEEDIHSLFPSASIKRIRAWEKGKSMPSLQETIFLCNLFNISMDELIHYSSSILN